MSMTPIIYKFCVLAIIFLLGFGIPKQGIRFPKRDASWELLKNVTMKPYFVLYGELYKNEIDGVCTKDSETDGCVPGYWLHPLLQAIYLMIATNAIVNTFFIWINIDYQKHSRDCDKVWMFQRYALVVGYRETLMLPPPLTFLGYLYLIIGKCINLKGHNTSNNGFYGNHLSDKQLNYLRSFEEQCVTNGLLEKDKRINATLKKKIKKAHKRMCKLDAMVSQRSSALGMAKKLPALNALLTSDVKDIESSISRMLAAAQVMDKRMAVLEALAEQRLAHVCQLVDLVQSHSQLSSLDSEHSSQAERCVPVVLFSSKQTSVGVANPAEMSCSSNQPAATPLIADANVGTAFAFHEFIADGLSETAQEDHKSTLKGDETRNTHELVCYSSECTAPANDSLIPCSARVAAEEMVSDTLASLLESVPLGITDATQIKSVVEESPSNEDQSDMPCCSSPVDSCLQLFSESPKPENVFSLMVSERLQSDRPPWLMMPEEPHQNTDNCLGKRLEEQGESCYEADVEGTGFDEDNVLLASPDDDVLLRGIEENAAVIIGERLQDKLLIGNPATGAASKEHTLLVDCCCNVADEVYPFTSPQLQFSDAPVSRFAENRDGGRDHHASLMPPITGEQTEVENTAALGDPGDKPLSRMLCNAADVHRIGRRHSIGQRGSFLRLPRPFPSFSNFQSLVNEHQRSFKSQAGNDYGLLRRNLSLQSVSSAAPSEFSAHTETSFLSA